MRTIVAVALLTLVAVIRVAATHDIFSATIDEPIHAAAGLEWLHGSYDLDPSHPPLARILGALPLWLRGDPMPEGRTMVGIGLEVVYHGADYVQTLRLMRLPNLIFLVIAIFAIAAWARRAFSDNVAIIAVALLTNLPPVLGHAGLLTTDAAALASIPLFLLMLDRYLEQPTISRGVALGASIGFGLLAKFSFLPFGLACGVIVLVARLPRRIRVTSLAVAIAVAFLILSLGYRFDYDKFTLGLAMVKGHNSAGHASYLFGEVRMGGFWYYFPVVLFYKTPIPYLLLALWGCILAIRERLSLALLPFAILAVSMTSSINIGVRHILPLYAPLSIIAAYGAVDLWKRNRIIVIALFAWLVINSTLAHPDYLAWFNEAAGKEPSRIAVDSNLDWGQDALRLARAREALHLEPLTVDILGNVRYPRHGLSVQPFDAKVPVHGWLAVSETQLALKRPHGDYLWLDAYTPVRRIGKSIRLYALP